MTAISTSAKSVKRFVMVGPEALMLRAAVLPDTTHEQIKAINDALTTYVDSRQTLESDRSGAQWSRVNEHLNNVHDALRFVGDATVVQGTALWELPSDSSKLKTETANVPTDVPLSNRRNLLEEKKGRDSPSPTEVSKPKSRAAGKKEAERAKSSLPGPSLKACLPAPEEPTVDWLTGTRDLIVDMGEVYQSKAAAEIGTELWCQLVFLNVHRGHSRTLNKTRVSKIDISDWDLIPVEAGEPAKRCVGEAPDGVKKSRKRRRVSESPAPPTRRRKVDSDDGVDNGGDDDDDDDDPVLWSSTHPLTSSKIVRPRPLLNLRKPYVAIPKSNLNFLSKPKSAFPVSWPDVVKPGNPFNPSLPGAGSTRVPETSVPSQDPPPTTPDSSLQKLLDESQKHEPLTSEKLEFDVEPDPEEVQKVIKGFKDMDLDGYKVELAKTKVALDRALKRNQVILEGLQTYVNRDKALITTLRRKEVANHDAMMRILDALF
ncbi:uncharacterized protein EV420DRAFT_1653463 [Desarmillaria tabescens]|uniref:Uncharacterized protein n=1 Tax=Armillaria tabescens TaxID=1929756 RepID=A0AA39J6A2_ARMTA|nr:uncharacterized protein EV420DRAFT_1653463 [Desarmillaria tabescens]KAK0435088.1 hypothetical protein EV420DRAFT_1653463 [Desarmillaria tabescens]